jgi:N-hydroxyarylamine O-acetyltransferase
MHDVGAYLERLGLNGRPGLAELHRAHVHSIPFENLEPHRGHPVPLEIDGLERKMVEGRRGGYCFEQNLLFKSACEAMGAEVETYLARVRWRAPAGMVRPRTHLVLGVRAEGATWLADVGFGAGTPLEPMPFGPGGPYEQSGWTYRVVEDGPELVLQRLDCEVWGDVYAFSPEPSPFVDIELSNWYVSTHPQSPFVKGIIVSRRPADGSVELLSDWSGELRLVNETPVGTTGTPVTMRDAPEVLATRFGLAGFEIGTDGRLGLG